MRVGSRVPIAILSFCTFDKGQYPGILASVSELSSGNMQCQVDCNVHVGRRLRVVIGKLTARGYKLLKIATYR